MRRDSKEKLNMNLIGCALSLALSLAVSSVAAQDVKATKFKGLYIGMSKTEAVALRRDFGETVQIIEGGADLAYGTCSVIYLDESSHVNMMILKKCFFGANDMSDSQFSQAIMTNYGIQSLECGFERTLNDVVKICSGLG
jgi:hypothetical protein